MYKLLAQLAFVSNWMDGTQVLYGMLKSDTMEHALTFIKEHMNPENKVATLLYQTLVDNLQIQDNYNPNSIAMYYKHIEHVMEVKLAQTHATGVMELDDKYMDIFILLTCVLDIAHELPVSVGFKLISHACEFLCATVQFERLLVSDMEDEYMEYTDKVKAYKTLAMIEPAVAAKEMYDFLNKHLLKLGNLVNKKGVCIC